MAKPLQTHYEKAFTQEGNEVLKHAENEVRALLGIIGMRLMLSELDSAYTLRDALQMMTARHLDAKSEGALAQLQELQKKLAKEKSSPRPSPGKRSVHRGR